MTEETYEEKRAREMRETKALTVRCCDILALMGCTDVKADGDHWSAKATGTYDAAQGLTLSIQDGGYRHKGTLTIWGRQPSTTKHHEIIYNEEKLPDVHVTIEKSNEQIAKDFNRRYIPSFLARSEVMKNRGWEMEVKEEKRRALVRALGERLGVDVRVQNREGKVETVAYSDYRGRDENEQGITHIKVEVTGYGTKIEVDAGDKAALALATTIGKLLKEAKE